MSVSGVVLAGTHVWYPEPVRGLEPRLLLPVDNQPLIEYGLRWLRRVGARSIAVCMNQGLRAVRRHLGDGSRWGCQVQYYVDRMPRGPAGCVRDASLVLPADDYVVIEGSVIPVLDGELLLSAHRRSGALVTVVVDDGDSQQRRSDDGAAPAGVYVFRREALARVSPNGYQDIKEALIPQLLRSGAKVCVFPVHESLPWVNGLASYLAAQGWVLEHIDRFPELSADYVWDGQVAVAPTAHVAPGARVIGPAMVGAGTRIDSGALLIGPVVVGRDCQLGQRTVVINSVLWDRTVLEHDSRVESSVIISETLVRRNAVLRGVVRQTPARRRHLLPRPEAAVS